MKHKAKKHIFALHLPERVYYFSAPSQWVYRAECELLSYESLNIICAIFMVDQLVAKFTEVCIKTMNIDNYWNITDYE